MPATVEQRRAHAGAPAQQRPASRPRWRRARRACRRRAAGIDDLRCRADLDQAAAPEHGDTVGKLGGQRDVVADEHQRHAVLGHQPVDQRDDLGLDDRVERAGRLVGDQQFRSGGDRRGDRDALALAAGKLVRKGSGDAARVGQADAVEQLDGLVVGAARRPRPRCVADHLGDLLADRHHRVEAGAGVLEDEADVAAADAARGRGPANAIVPGRPAP